MNKAFFEREYTCPVCRTTFKSFSVRSSATYVEEKESDFHVRYKGVSPLHYSIIVCPVCEYAASNTTFAKELSLNMAEQLAVALSRLRSNDGTIYGEERDLDITLKAFQLAIRTAQLKKVSPAELSGLLLAAGWITREMKNIDLEKVYVNEALKHYVEAFNNGSREIGNLNDLQATYLIGDLYRRCGEYREAISWFNKVISHKNIKNNPNVEKLARDGWALAREESKNMPIAADAEPEKPVMEVEAPPIAEEEKAQVEPPRRRVTMQMSAGLYTDQIEWLKKISNEGYKNNNKLFTREQVLRSIIDFLMEELGEQIPSQFSTEEELIHEFKQMIAVK